AFAMTPRLTLAIPRLLAVRQHLADGRHVLVGHLCDRTKLALTLRSLLRQDVVQVRLPALEAAVSLRTEALRGAAIRLQLRHVFLLDLWPEASLATARRAACPATRNQALRHVDSCLQTIRRHSTLRGATT